MTCTVWPVSSSMEVSEHSGHQERLNPYTEFQTKLLPHTHFQFNAGTTPVWDLPHVLCIPSHCTDHDRSADKCLYVSHIC